jgi:hypothetical protein
MMSPPAINSMTNEPREVLNRFMRWLCHHLVSLSCVYHHVDDEGRRTGGPFLAACSGFVMSFGEAWYLVTAGHIISGKDSHGWTTKLFHIS